MNFLFTCPYCKKTFNLTDSWIGKKAICPSCKNQMIVTPPQQGSSDIHVSGTPVPEGTKTGNNGEKIFATILTILGLVYWGISVTFNSYFFLAYNVRILDHYEWLQDILNIWSCWIVPIFDIAGVALSIPYFVLRKKNCELNLAKRAVIHWEYLGIAGSFTGIFFTLPNFITRLYHLICH